MAASRLLRLHRPLMLAYVSALGHRIWVGGDRSVGGLTVSVVAPGGELACSVSFGAASSSAVPPSERTVYRIGSLSKSVTCVALLSLVEQGLLALDDEVGLYVPEVYRIPGYVPITLRQLASHTAGLGREPSAVGVSSGSVDTWEELVLRAIPTASFVYAPGSCWRYCNIGFAILGLAIARVCRRNGLGGTHAWNTLPELVRQRLFEPFGMHDASYLVPSHKRQQLAQGFTQETVDSLLAVPIGQRDWYPSSTLRSDDLTMLEMCLPAVFRRDRLTPEWLLAEVKRMQHPPTASTLLDLITAHADSPHGRQHGEDHVAELFMRICPESVEWTVATATLEERGRGYRLANGGVYASAQDLGCYIGMLSGTRRGVASHEGRIGLTTTSMEAMWGTANGKPGSPDPVSGAVDTTAQLTPGVNVAYGLGLFFTDQGIACESPVPLLVPAFARVLCTWASNQLLQITPGQRQVSRR